MKARHAAPSVRTSALWPLLLLIVAAPRLSWTQTPEQLLNDTAKNYQTLTDYELHGHAVVTILGSVWQPVWDFSVVGPRKEPSPDGGPPRIVHGAGRIGRSKFVKTVADSPEPQPSDASFPSILLMHFGTGIADSVVSVERTGSETLKFNQEDVACDILKVTYAPSPPEKTYSESVTYWISPQRHLVLKEVLTSNAGRHIEHALWTLAFDTAKFDRPPPQWFLDMADIPAVREHTEWFGKAAPEFALPASDGSIVTLSSLRGKEVLLDFWSISCGPCRREMPMIEEVSHEFEDRGVVLLGISCDPAQKSKAWLEKNSRTLHTLTDSDFVASDAYKIQGVPALVLIGRDGKVKQYWEGAVSKSTLEAALNSLPKN